MIGAGSAGRKGQPGDVDLGLARTIVSFGHCGRGLWGEGTKHDEVDAKPSTASVSQLRESLLRRRLPASPFFAHDWRGFCPDLEREQCNKGQ